MDSKELQLDCSVRYAQPGVRPLTSSKAHRSHRGAAFRGRLCATVSTKRDSGKNPAAQSVAYSVCDSLGLDTSGDSVPYLAGWGGEEAADSIERYAQLIDRLASRLEQVLVPDDC